MIKKRKGDSCRGTFRRIYRAEASAAFSPVLLAVLLAALPVLLLGSCRRDNAEGLAERLFSLETPGRAASGENYDEKRLEELKEQVEKWRDELNRTIEASQDLAYYYKLLGLKYMDYKSYKLAHENFIKAIEIQPENAVLHYRAGLSAAQMKKSVPGRKEQEEWLKKAEFYYQRAVELSPSYTRALYGLAVLSFYELDKPRQAAEALDQLLKTSPHHPRALFLRANLYLRSGRPEKAVEAYETIMDTAKGEAYKEKARENRDKVLKEWGRE